MVSSKTDASYSPVEPLRIIDSKSSIFFVSADVGITIGTGVSAWADQSGNSNSFSQATGGSQPAFIANDADFGGRNSVYNTSGGSLFLVNSWVPPLPGSTNQWYFIVFRQVSWTSADYIFSSNTAASTISLAQSGSTPSLAMANTSFVNSNSGAAIAASVRGEVFFNNSTAGYLKLGSTKVTGGNAGNNNAGSTGLRLFTRNGGTQSSDVKVACFGCWSGEPTAGEKVALDMWVQRYYMGTVAV